MQRFVDSSNPVLRPDVFVLSVRQPRAISNFGTSSATVMNSCDASTRVENGSSILSSSLVTSRMPRKAFGKIIAHHLARAMQFPHNSQRQWRPPRPIRFETWNIPSDTFVLGQKLR